MTTTENLQCEMKSHLLCVPRTVHFSRGQVIVRPILDQASFELGPLYHTHGVHLSEKDNNRYCELVGGACV